MKRHQEVRLSSPHLSARQILEAAVRFAQESDGWEPHPNGIREAGMGVGEHCVIVSLRPPAAGIALVAEDGNPKAVHVTNIVPRDTDELTFAEYNAIARLFHEALRSYGREQKLALKVTITPEDRGLEVAISGAKCRRYFEDYLHGFPQTHHPSDVARLDAFICAVHRYGSRCDPDGVAQHLREAHGWPESDARFVRDRIRTGLDILRADRRFS